MKFLKSCTVKEIADLIEAKIDKPEMADHVVSGFGKIESANQQDLVFLANKIYAKYLATTKSRAVIVDESYDLSKFDGVALVTKNPRLALARVLTELGPKNTIKPEIHPTAVIAKTAKISANAFIGPNVVIGENSKIADNVFLNPGVIVGDDCVINTGTELKANVVVYSGVVIGKDCIVHSSTVIGSDGFGFANDNGKWVKMPHIGGVTIGDNVEIGSNTSIDRGVMDDTVIESNVIIDNLVQLAHNVAIGEGTAIAGCSAIAGSTKIGKHCLIGGGASIAGHIEITDFVNITGTSAVNRSIDTKGVYSSGFPAKENSVWRRNVARFGYLDSMAKRIKALEKKISE